MNQKLKVSNTQTCHWIHTEQVNAARNLTNHFLSYAWKSALHFIHCVPHTCFEEFSSKRKKHFKYLRFPNSSHMAKHSPLNYLNNVRHNVQSYPPHYVISCIPLHTIIPKYIFLKFYLEIQIKSARIYQ